jgi:predicted PurR-regulated permease PerM
LNLVSKLISYLSNAMVGLFLLLMTVAFMLLEVPQLPYKIEQMSDEPGKGMANVQRALDSVTRYLVIKTLISVVTGLAVWALLAATGDPVCVFVGNAGVCAELHSQYRFFSGGNPAGYSGILVQRLQ